MNLDKRLEGVAKFVPNGCIMADIGTDHAYLPTALLQNDKIRYAIASDVALQPCKVAATTLAMYGLTTKSVVRQGNGLSVLQEGEVDCIVLAGMGGSTIIDILDDSIDVAKSVKRVICQPMLAADKLRKYFFKKGFKLTEETLIEDGKFLYEIIVAEVGKDKCYSDAEYLIGPLLLKNKHPLLSKQIARQKDVLKRILFGMRKSSGAKESNKYRENRKLLEELESLENDIG